MPPPLPDLVVICRGLPTVDVLAAGAALRGAGVTAFEVTLNSPDALKSVAALSAAFGSDALIGVGTVRTVAEVHAAADAGAAFLLSPHLDEEIVAATKDAGLVSVPGALTPTEVVRARAAGADVVKLFPVAPAGAEYVRQLRAPLPDIPLLATGGVTAELGRLCLRAGCVSVGTGAGLIDGAALGARDWPALAASARRYLAVLRGGVGNPAGPAASLAEDTTPAPDPHEAPARPTTPSGGTRS